MKAAIVCPVCGGSLRVEGETGPGRRELVLRLSEDSRGHLLAHVRSAETVRT